jgi:TonB family protein
MTQGLLAAMIANTAPADLRGAENFNRPRVSVVTTGHDLPLARRFSNPANNLDLIPLPILLPLALATVVRIRRRASSGHEALDQQVLEMVRESMPLPRRPIALAGRPLTVNVTVVFRINS